MDSALAAEVLRRNVHATCCAYDDALGLAVSALEAWAWVERTGATVEPMSGGWSAEMIDAGGRWVVGTGATPLEAVLDAMKWEKEKKS